MNEKWLRFLNWFRLWLLLTAINVGVGLGLSSMVLWLRRDLDLALPPGDSLPLVIAAVANVVLFATLMIFGAFMPGVFHKSRCKEVD